MAEDILDEVQRLRAEHRPFALATVVAAHQPTSGTPGARAIVVADGHVEGWIGGHCAQPAVVRQALDALADGAPRLVMLSPDDAPAEDQRMPGVIHVPMRCAGQGELHIFVEPFLPKVALTVIGASPVARMLARLGALLDFEVWACDPDANMETFAEAARLTQTLSALGPQITPRHYVVVATIGVYDEDAVLMALESPASYVGLIASQKRFDAVRAYLRDQGVPEERLNALKRPKGIPGQALVPAEIAFSAVAELLEMRRQRVGLALEEAPPPKAEAIDPICGMTVDIATAQHTSERGGQTYYFCCAGCKAKFERS